MSADINVFVKTNTPIADFVPALSQSLGVQLSPEPPLPWPLFYGRLAEMEVRVFEADGYETDRDMDFPSYQIQISLGPLTEVPSHDDSIEQVALSLARDIRYRLRCPTMVTWDVQRLLARFE